MTGLSRWRIVRRDEHRHLSCGHLARFPGRLLDHAKAMGILHAVKDESHFWEDRDVKALVETVGQWNRHIAAFVGQYKDRFGGVFVAPIAEFPDFEHLEAEGHRPENGQDGPACD
jgi:hypothetical protein